MLQSVVCKENKHDFKEILSRLFLREDFTAHLKEHSSIRWIIIRLEELSTMSFVIFATIIKEMKALQFLYLRNTWLFVVPI